MVHRIQLPTERLLANTILFILWHLCDIIPIRYMKKEALGPSYYKKIFLVENECMTRQLAHVAYVRTSNFIAVSMILDMCTWKRTLNFS